MTKVIGVRFRTAGKIYFFAPGKLNIQTGQYPFQWSRIISPSSTIQYIIAYLM